MASSSEREFQEKIKRFRQSRSNQSGTTASDQVRQPGTVTDNPYRSNSEEEFQEKLKAFRERRAQSVNNAAAAPMEPTTRKKQMQYEDGLGFKHPGRGIQTPKYANTSFGTANMDKIDTSEYDRKLALDLLNQARRANGKSSNSGFKAITKEEFDGVLSPEESVPHSGVNGFDDLTDYILSDDKFKEYSDAGASLENPSWEDINNSFSINGWNPFRPEIKNKAQFAFDAINQGALEDYADSLQNRNADIKKKVLPYRYMTDTERKVYDYYVGLAGEEGGDAYIDAMKEEWNKREAAQLLEETKKPMGKLAVSLGSGVESSINGLEGAASLAMGLVTREGQAAPLSSLQMAHAENMQNTKGIEKVGNDVLYGVGNMALPMLAGSIGGPLVGAVVRGASTGGNEYEGALREGKGVSQAQAYGLLQGTLEAATSALLGGISKVSKYGTTKLATKIPAVQTATDKINKVVQEVVKNPTALNALNRMSQHAGSMFNEGFEEYLQETLNPVIRNVCFDENNEIKAFSEEQLYAGLLGALTAGVLEVVPNVASDISDMHNAARAGKAVNAAGSVDSYVDAGLSMDTDTLAWKMADYVAKNQQAGKEVSNLDAGVLANATYNEARNNYINKVMSEPTNEPDFYAPETVKGTDAEIDIPSQPVDWNNTDAKAYQENAIQPYAEEYSGHGKQAMIDNYDGTVDPEVYSKGYFAYYGEGRYGMEYGQTHSLYGAMMPEQARMAAYEAGAADRNAAMQTQVQPGTAEPGGLVSASENATDAQKTFTDIVGRKTGLKFEIVDSMPDAYGEYSKGIVKVALDSKNFSGTVSHELTHYIKDYAPQDYQAYQDIAVQAMMQSENVKYDDLVESYLNRHRQVNDTFTRDDAVDEIVADATERFFNDADYIEQIVKENKTLGQRILDFLNDLVESIKQIVKTVFPENKASQAMNENLEMAQKAQELWYTALDNASKNRNLVTAPDAKAPAERLKTHSETVPIDNSISSKEGNSKNQLKDKANSEFSYENLVLKEDMPVTILKGSMPIKDGKIDRAEVRNRAIQNVRSLNNPLNTDINSYVKNKDLGKDILIATHAINHGLRRKAEVNAFVTANMGEILENAICINELVPRSNEIDRTYALLGYGMDENNNVYPTVFVVNEYKNGNSELEDIDVLYSLNSKKGSAHVSAGVHGNDTTSPTLPSTISISDLLFEVKDYFSDVLPQSVLDKLNIQRANTPLSQSVKYQLKDIENVDSVALKENEQLKETNAFLKKQLELTKEFAPRKGDLEKVAGKVLKTYSSKYDKATLVSNLETLFRYIQNSDHIDGADVADITSSIAKAVLNQSSQLDTTMSDNYADLQKTLKNTAIRLSDIDKADLDTYGGYNTFRKQYYGKINLSKDGIAVDAFYEELSSQYPELFDLEITHPADCLIAIADVMDSLQPAYRNPYGANMDEMAVLLAYEIYDDYFSVRPEPPTFADKKAKELEKVKVQYRRKIYGTKMQMREKYNQRLFDAKKKNIEKISALTEKYNNAQAKQKEHYKEQIKKIREQKNEALQVQQTKYRERIKNAAKAKKERQAIKDNGLGKVVNGVDLTEKYSTGTELDNKIADLVAEHGAIDKGEKFAKNIDVPKKSSEGKNVRSYVRTVLESSVITNDMVQGIEQSILDEAMSYEPVGDNMALHSAESAIKNQGVEGVAKEWDAVVNSSKAASKYDIALGERLLKEYAEKGDVAGVVKMTAELAEEGTRAGQVIQAMRLFKKMTGETENGGIYDLYYIKKSVDNINRDLRKRFAGSKNIPQLQIDNALAEKLAATQPGAERESVLGEIYLKLGEQMPATLADKVNNWRYLAMLGNPKTHIRNMVGNAIFVPVVKLKNLIGVAMETNPKVKEKTKSVFVSKEYKEYAKNDFKQMGEFLLSDGKTDTKSRIMENRQIYKGWLGWLETARKKNLGALEMEDALFLKNHYISALGQYLQSNKVDLSQVKDGEPILERARAYAINEAQKATYRDASALANLLSRAARSNKTAYLFIEGTQPFKKTPINIVKRGVEYSPAGLIYTLTYGSKKLHNGNITINQWIDGLSSGLSGTVIMAIGAFLAASGFLQGAAGDDKDQDLLRLEGGQEYAVNIGGKTYTIDWTAPASIPLFIGAELYGAVNGEWENMTFGDITEALSTITEPMFNLSMLQGINNTIDAVSHEQNKLTALGQETVANFIGQFVPTVIGQVARTIDGTQRRTYTDKNSQVPKEAQYFIQKVMNKVPFLSFLNEPRLDQFGRENFEGNPLTRAFENFVSPGYISDKEDDPIVKEIRKLYDETGETKAIPPTAAMEFKVNGEDKKLTAEEYTIYQKAVGKSSYELLKTLISRPDYDSLNASAQIEVISKIYDYSKDLGKMAVSDYELEDWKARAYRAYKEGDVPVIDYIMLTVAVSAEGKRNQTNTSAIIKKLPLSNSQKKALSYYYWETPKEEKKK